MLLLLLLLLLMMMRAEGAQPLLTLRVHPQHQMSLPLNCGVPICLTLACLSATNLAMPSLWKGVSAQLHCEFCTRMSSEARVA